MSLTLQIILIVFCILWTATILILLRKNKLPIKYSLIWFAAIAVIFFVSVFPIVLEKISEILGFISVTNLIIGIMFTLLLIITLILTTLVYRQKKQIINLIQEISIVKSKVK